MASKKASSLLLAYQNDICLFAEKVLNISPTKQQQQVLKSFEVPGSWTSVRSGHGTGKTASLAICAIWHTSLWRPSKTIVTAPAYPQLRDAFLPELHLILSRADKWFRDGIYLIRDRMSVKGKEEIQFMSARTAKPGEESSLQGARADYTAYLIDECYGVSDRVFQVIKGSSSKGGVQLPGERPSVYRLLMGGNPTRSDGFAYDSHNKLRDQFTSIRLNSEESPLVGPEFLKRFQKDTDEYRVRVLGEHPLVSQNTLIPRGIAEEAALRNYQPSMYEYAPIVIGCDPAWMGSDRSVIVMRQGLFSKIIFVKQGADSIEIAGKIQEAWTRPGLYNPVWVGREADACFVDMGMGNGVIDQLRRLGRHPIPVAFGGSSTREDCHLKRMEIWANMADWLREGGQIERNEDLVSELAGVEYAFNLAGKKVLESKDNMRERTGRSPDLAEALAVTFSEAVHVQRSEVQRRMAAEKKQEWAPFQEFDAKIKSEGNYDPWNGMM